MSEPVVIGDAELDAAAARESMLVALDEDTADLLERVVAKRFGTSSTSGVSGLRGAGVPYPSGPIVPGR